MRDKLVTNHKTHAFIFHTSHHITEFISYQTKNNTTQPNNRNHVRIRKLTQKKKKKFREWTQRGGRWLGKPRKLRWAVSGDRSEREERWLGVDGLSQKPRGGAGGTERRRRSGTRRRRDWFSGRFRRREKRSDLQRRGRVGGVGSESSDFEWVLKNRRNED